MKKSRMLSFFLFVSLVLITINANAGEGYICRIMHFPTNSGYGSYGYVKASVYSSSDCGGTLVGEIARCSTNASATSCALGYLAPNTETILATAARWQRAADEGSKVRYYTTDNCGGTGTGCFSYMYLNYY